MPQNLLLRQLYVSRLEQILHQKLLNHRNASICKLSFIKDLLSQLDVECKFKNST